MNREALPEERFEGNSCANSPSNSVREILQRHHSRKKRHLAWEQAELASGGLYARYVDEIARHFPQLTAMELRVAALVKAMLPSWRIAEILGIDERTVENHRVHIRRKLGVHGTNLCRRLLSEP